MSQDEEEDKVRYAYKEPSFTDVNRAKGRFTLDLCEVTFVQRSWTSGWASMEHVKEEEVKEERKPIEELALFHETVGHLAGNLYELSVKLNDLGGSNSFAYSAYILGLWLFRLWRLIQLQGEAFERKHTRLQSSEEERNRRVVTLISTIARYATASLKDDDDDGFIQKTPYEEEGARRHEKAPSLSTRHLFEPGYDAWRIEKPFEEDEKRRFTQGQLERNMRICLRCVRKEIRILEQDVNTMHVVRHRPAFQSFRVSLDKTFDEFERPLLSNSHTLKTKDLRRFTRALAECIERLAVVNESGVKRARAAQLATLDTLRNEGIIAGLILTTAASALALVVSLERSARPAIDTAAFILFESSTILSLWASLLYMLSSVRLSHSLSRPFM
ncbi:hypothetical protein FA10DRAFT_298934, partial [Acaromyces ingoldii]